MQETWTLRLVTDLEEVAHFQQLEQRVWHSSAEDLVPVHVAITVIRNGGGLLGAFDPAGPRETGGMVGLTFWFPGFGVPTTNAEGNRVEAAGPCLKICSHMAGVLPEWQGRGLGAQLKWAQRQAILAQGQTRWVTWTYDPLLRTNALLNIRRLGAVRNTYQRNWYGLMQDGLNAGMPSDRCQVDWWLDSQRVQERADEAPRLRSAAPSVPASLYVVPGQTSLAGLPAPDEGELPLDGRALALPIPDAIAELRRRDASLGMAWRLALRHQLEHAFAAGYVMVDCLQLADGQWHYLLEMRPVEPIAGQTAGQGILGKEATNGRAL